MSDGIVDLAFQNGTDHPPMRPILIKARITPVGTTCGTDPTGGFTPTQNATIQAWADGGQPL